MIITTLSGQSELLTDYKNLTRKRRVNGDYSLSFLLMKTNRNEHSFPLVVEETTINYEGVAYRIKDINERLLGNTPVKEIRAEHTFFDVIDVYQYGTLTTGYKSINETLNFALQGTGYTFSVIDSYPTVEFDNFGDDNALSLFKTILERYQAEYEVIGKDVRIRKQIGTKTDNQFRYSYNVKTFAKNINTDNLSTYIKGYGKQNEDGSYVVTAEYTSPNAPLFPADTPDGLRHAEPVYDDRFTEQSSLLSYIQSQIQDTPEISMTVEFVDDVPGLGDEWYLIYEPLNLDISVRILEIEDYPESNNSPRVTLANHLESFADVVFRHTKSQLDKIWDENSKKIRYNVLDEAVKRATEALNNSLTELEYPPNMGIVARDPNDPNRFTVLRSAGLGVTTNGVDFENAVTPEGINTNLLVAGQIKTNNIQIIGEDDLFYWDGTQLIAISPDDANKYVRLNSGGMYIAKGAMTIERPDGYKVINNGISNYSYTITPHDPPFKSEGVEVWRTWYRMKSLTALDLNFYTFKHESKYLMIDVGYFVDGGSAVLTVVDAGNSEELAYKFFTNDQTTDEAMFGTVITVDLGDPTGNPKSVYVRLRSGSELHYVYGRIRRMWLEG